jgi:hypothetical protein
MQIEQNLRYSDKAEFGVCVCGAGLIYAKGEVNKAECTHVITCIQCGIVHAQTPVFEEIERLSAQLSLQGLLTARDSDRSPFFKAIKG